MKYATIVADPPWPLHERSGGRKDHARPGGFGLGNNSRSIGYPLMSIEKLQQLPVSGLAADDAHLYCWTFNAFVPDTYELVQCWGFRPVTLLTWAKVPRGLGMGGTFTNTTEFVLFCRRGSLKPLRKVDTSWWNWKRGARHSQKPDGFLDLVESVSPGPYLELFARRARFGWDYWGNESLGTVELAV